MKSIFAAVGAAIVVTLASPAVQADSIADVEGARAKERSGFHLNWQDREQLRRYGRKVDNGDYGDRDYGGSDGYDSGYVYVAPRYFDDPSRD